MLSALTPSPMAHWLTAMPVCSPRTAAASDCDDVLDVDVADLVDEPLEERHRVLAGDEGVAGVHVHAAGRGCRRRPASGPSSRAWW